MRSSIQRLNILFTAVFSIAPVVIAQPEEPVTAFGNKAYAEHNYQLAVREYQRVLFFHLHYDEAVILERLGNAYFMMNQYERAIEYYDHAMLLHTSDSARYSCLFRKVFSMVLHGQYQYALIELYSIHDSLPEPFYREYEFYLAVCLFRLGAFDDAKKAFLASIPPDREEARAQLNSLLEHKKYLEKPNPNTAFVLSMILPGAGQLYAGDIKNGLNSMILNGILIFIFVNTTLNYTIFDAMLTVFPWFQRYYQGGFTRAKDIAMHKREDRRNEICRQILTVIAVTRD